MHSQRGIADKEIERSLSTFKDHDSQHHMVKAKAHHEEVVSRLRLLPVGFGSGHVHCANVQPPVGLTGNGVTLGGGAAHQLEVLLSHLQIVSLKHSPGSTQADVS